MRITKVYTRTGDTGETSLATGERVSKASLRVCAYGDVDELNSFLGLARCRITGAALLHVARAVARRAERTTVHLAKAETINPHALVYLNRLSDLLFVLARVVNQQGGSAEVSAQFH